MATVKEYDGQPRHHASGRFISEEDAKTRSNAVQPKGGDAITAISPTDVKEESTVESVPPRGKTPLEP